MNIYKTDCEHQYEFVSDDSIPVGAVQQKESYYMCIKCGDIQQVSTVEGTTIHEQET